MSRMTVRATFLVIALVGVAAADPKPKPIDIKPFRDKLIVLEDAAGGVYAVSNDSKEPHVFYGTAKVLYQAVLDGSRTRDGDAWTIAVMAPRTAYPFIAVIERRKDGSYRHHCGNTGPELELTERTGDKAKAILDKASFLTTQMIRRPHLLARDDKGVYYYIDVLRDQYGGNGHRVFVGKRGALKQLPLTDVATDIAGEVYSTKSGDLRLVKTADTDSSKARAQWIRGERKNELVYLDTFMSQPLIWRELGIYKISGTLCGAL